MRAVFTIILIFSFLSIFADTFEDYYPLSVGDYWIQHSDIWSGGNNPVTFTMENEAIDQIGGEDYVRKLNWLLWDDGSDEAIWYTWLRSSDEGIILGAFGSSVNINEATIFDPPILWFPNDMYNLGNTYEIVIPAMGGTFSFITDQVGASVTVPAGTFDNCVVISLTIADSTNTITQENEYYFAYQIGEVRNYGWSAYAEYSELELIEYEVNVSSPQNEIPVNDLYLTNYPNPFNPTTTIEFSVTQTSSFVTLEIYNLRGQRVKTFNITPRPSTTLRMTQAGSNQYSVVWNGTDDNNESVASGIYFYKVKSGELVQTKKMILMK